MCFAMPNAWWLYHCQIAWNKTKQKRNEAKPNAQVMNPGQFCFFCGAEIWLSVNAMVFHHRIWFSSSSYISMVDFCVTALAHFKCISQASMLNLSKFWKMASIKIIAKLLPTAYTRTDKLLKEHIHSMWLSNQMKLQLFTSVILDSMSNRWKPEWQHSTVQPITGLNVYQVWWTSAQNMKISRWFICITKNRRMSVRNSCNADITWRYSLSYRIYGIGSVI